MCSIVSSFDTETARELCKINNYRGALSHSITYIKNSQIISLERKEGQIDLNKIDIPSDCYCIIHQQAPTQQSNNIHPAQNGHLCLWHNGILMQDTIDRLKIETNSSSDWDTYLLLNHLLTHNVPENIHGSFACLMFDNFTQGLYAFRNEIVNLYIDDNLNISSTEFKNSKLIRANELFVLDLDQKIELVSLGIKFKTTQNPYFFIEEQNEI